MKYADRRHSLHLRAVLAVAILTLSQCWSVCLSQSINQSPRCQLCSQQSTRRQEPHWPCLERIQSARCQARCWKDGGSDGREPTKRCRCGDVARARIWLPMAPHCEPLRGSRCARSRLNAASHPRCACCLSACSATLSRSHRKPALNATTLTISAGPDALLPLQAARPHSSIAQQAEGGHEERERASPPPRPSGQHSAVRCSAYCHYSPLVLRCSQDGISRRRQEAGVSGHRRTASCRSRARQTGSIVATIERKGGDAARQEGEDSNSPAASTDTQAINTHPHSFSAHSL